MKRYRPLRLTRAADAFMPAALLVAACLGRDGIAANLFLSTLLVRLCGLSTSTGLRAAFAAQPSRRAAQGSACVALIAQLVGAGFALLIFPKDHPYRWALIACGLLVNIELVFYEYLAAMGEGESATLCHGLAALLALTGLLLGCPPGLCASDARDYSDLGLMIPCILAALSALAVGLSEGGRLRPKLNLAVLRRFPIAMLKTALYPAAALLILSHSGLDIQTRLPLWTGLIVYELCRTPFRRTKEEARPMNRALVILCVISLGCMFPFVMGFRFTSENPLLHDVPYALGGIVLASICSFVMYGNL